MEHIMIPAIAIPLPPFFIPFIPSISPTMVTGYPAMGRHHAINPTIPSTMEAMDIPFSSSFTGF
jgi:hypothetical protein